VEDINWMKTSGVSNGCKPEDTDYCPEDFVTRQQMAALMHRMAENQFAGAATVEGKTAADSANQWGVYRFRNIVVTVVPTAPWPQPSSDSQTAEEGRGDIRLPLLVEIRILALAQESRVRFTFGTYGWWRRTRDGRGTPEQILACCHGYASLLQPPHGDRHPFSSGVQKRR
jgi:hypothetical protein